MQWSPWEFIWWQGNCHSRITLKLPITLWQVAWTTMTNLYLWYFGNDFFSHTITKNRNVLEFLTASQLLLGMGGQLESKVHPAPRHKPPPPPLQNHRGYLHQIMGHNPISGHLGLASAHTQPKCVWTLGNFAIRRQANLLTQMIAS